MASLYRKLRSRNPVPSKYEAWEDGERTRDIPIERVIGGPPSEAPTPTTCYRWPTSSPTPSSSRRRSRRPECSAGHRAGGGAVAQSAALGIDRAFGTLDHALNRRASRRDPQGVVRR